VHKIFSEYFLTHPIIIFDTLFDVWHGIVPVILIFYRKEALEMLRLQYLQHLSDVKDTLSPDTILLSFDIFLSWLNILEVQ
jgi:hypothetical protein